MPTVVFKPREGGGGQRIFEKNCENCTVRHPFSHLVWFNQIDFIIIWREPTGVLALGISRENLLCPW